MWFLPSPGFQQHIGTDFCSILANLGDFYNFLPCIVQISTKFGLFQLLMVPDLVDIFLPDLVPLLKYSIWFFHSLSPTTSCDCQ